MQRFSPYLASIANDPQILVMREKVHFVPETQKQRASANSLARGYEAWRFICKKLIGFKAVSTLYARVRNIRVFVHICLVLHFFCVYLYVYSLTPVSKSAFHTFPLVCVRILWSFFGIVCPS